MRRAGAFSSTDGAIKLPRTAKEKVAQDNDKYIYARPPFLVKVQGTVVGYAKTRKEAVVMRDEYLNKQTK